MALKDLWSNSRDQLENKHVQQIITFAGQGKLNDGSVASSEFRELLSYVPSSILERYSDECLQNSFTGSGFALQDIVNQVGRRLGFTVTDGRYRGAGGQIGYDGLWQSPESHIIVVEVKTTDAYRIDLDTIARYRRRLINDGKALEENSSILIVVGRKDTGDLEAQIRGSRHAWDIRLISVDALLRLMALKEEVEDPQIVHRIHEILIPREFTRLDSIVELVFTTAEDVKPEEPEEDEATEPADKTQAEPVSFHDACIIRAEQFLSQSLVKRTRTSYLSPDGALALTCAVSKTYERGDQERFWFAFHRHQKEFLDQAESSFVAFGCGSENTLVLIPAPEFVEWLEDLNFRQKGNRFYWYIHITKDDGQLLLHRSKGKPPVDVTEFVVPGESSS